MLVGCDEMTVIEDLFMNSLFILFPLFSYFLFATSTRNLNKHTKDILFDLALYTSLYCLLRNNTPNITFKMMFLTVPLLIAYLKGKTITSIIFSICIGMYYVSYIEINVSYVIAEFVIYFILMRIFKFKNESDKTLISVFAIIKIAFIVMELHFIINNYDEVFEQLIISSLAFYFTTHLICYLMVSSEKTMNLHMTIKELESEKQLRDSLFKITHEIKNPIAVCKGYLDMIDIDNKTNVRRYISIIKQEIERTLTIMNDFMMLTKVHVEKRDMDVSVLLQDVCEISYFMLKERKIKFSSSIIDEEVFINGDYDRLKQVFINVIKNAMEAIPTSKRGIVKFTNKLTAKELILTITDNGVGMNKEVINRIGEAFYTTKKSGTGLGVKFSKEIIEAHNGSIEYKSKLNIGTMVIIILPIKKSL